MEQLGFEPRIIGTEALEAQWHYEAHGYAVLDREFSAGRLTNASILCANDRVAIGALSAAAAHGLEPGALRRGGPRGCCAGSASHLAIGTLRRAGM